MSSGGPARHPQPIGSPRMGGKGDIGPIVAPRHPLCLELEIVRHTQMGASYRCPFCRHSQQTGHRVAGKICMLTGDFWTISAGSRRKHMCAETCSGKGAKPILSVLTNVRISWVSPQTTPESCSPLQGNTSSMPDGMRLVRLAMFPAWR